MDRGRLLEPVAELYRVGDQLEVMFPGRHFTPDGRLLGSLGECLAAYHYRLDLLPASSAGVDAVAGRRKVEIEATQGKRVGLGSGHEHLLVLRLDRSRGFSEIYNGQRGLVWRELMDRPRPSNG